MPTSKKRKRPNKRAAPKKQAKTQQTPENHDIHAGVSEGSLGQQTQHPVTLGDLKRTMDPLIAAQVCNACHSPMGRLPEEIVLEILHYLRHVIVGLHCLRQVSARFRRLIYSKDIWRYLKLPRETSGPCIDPSEFWDYPDDLRERLQSHLQKDMMCNQCILNRDMHIVTRHQNKESSAVLLARAFSEAYRFITEPRTPELRRYCHGCRGHHDLLQFSDSEQQPEKQERQCLSRQGTVKLCEHIRIAWDDIETHIEHWLQRAPGDWQACFDHFKIECHDPSHDTRCTAEALPTWPRASLYSRNDGQVALKLEWAPHSGFGAIRLTADGRAPASDLRAIFARYRRGTAKIMLPAYRSDFLPEMVYFDPFRCSCLYYAGWNDGERIETKTPTGKSEDGTPLPDTARQEKLFPSV